MENEPMQPSAISDVLSKNGFIHKVCMDKDFFGNALPKSLTTLEFATLFSMKALPVIRSNLKALTHISSERLQEYRRPQNALHLLAQVHKKSDHEFTEIDKKMVKYNGSPYLARSYKFVKADYFKLEVSKSPLGVRSHMNPKTTAYGLLKLMSRLARGAEKEILPHYMHNGDYQTLQEYLDLYTNVPSV